MGEIYGVIGYPIGHSMSPAMHNEAFQALGMNHFYKAFLVSPESLEETVAAMKRDGIRGFNVTTPHKVEIMKYLDEVDELATQIGAVNTVVCKDGKYVGSNTDGDGYIRSLEEEMDVSVEGKKILIVGAGGAARAIYFSLLRKGVARMDIVNRSREKAEAIIAGNKQSLVYSFENVPTQQYDIIIQTTTIGMAPKITDSPFVLTQLKQECIVSDIIYNPQKTAFLAQAEKKGASIHNGIGMFIYQGALAFEKWTDVVPPIDRMKKIVINKLGE